MRARRVGNGLAFADEDHRALALFLLLVEMILAVLQLRDAQRDRLGALTGELLHVLQFLPQLLRVRHLRDDLLGKKCSCLWKNIFRSGKTSNPARHEVRLKTGLRVQLAGGHHADNVRGPSNRSCLTTKHTKHTKQIAQASKASCSNPAL